MNKTCGAVISGLVAWMAITSICSWATLHGWPAYAAAAPTRSYDSTMLLVRQSVGVIATLAAGAAVSAVERVMAADHRRALALVRPPGHHAERDRAMGFCLYNNIAVAAAAAKTLGAHRIAIVERKAASGRRHRHPDRPQGVYRRRQD